jgi:SH3 domain-containing YSC84-like protein 1
MKPRLSSCAFVVAAAAMLAACAHTPPSGSSARDNAADAQARVEKSAAVVDRMKSEPKVDALLRRAKGVLIVPDYGKAAWIVGGQGGVGVLTARLSGERWSAPAFYTIGGLSIGFQAGGEVGPVAFILMTDRAVQQFEDRTNRFSLGADAGLTVVSFSDQADIASTNGAPADVVAWSGAKGLFGGVSVGATDVMANNSLDYSYYHNLQVTPRDILAGNVHVPGGGDDVLKSALETRVASK